MEDTRLSDVLADYVDLSVSGKEPDRHTYLAKHPDLEQELQEYFATLDLLERLAKADGPEQQRIGHYRLLSRLGSGGMGVVYLARDEDDDRLVALKVLRAGALTATPEEVTRFRREADLALRHPNIAAVYDAKETDGQYYLVLQYVPGLSLRQLLAELRSTPVAELGSVDLRATVARLVSGEPPPATSALRGQSYYAAVASIAADLAEALDYAHGKHTIHRDVKPDNVLLDADGNAYLTDFGLAKITEGPLASLSRDIVGTAEYMSPQMAAGGDVDARTDVYSLGATMYALLTLQPPYAGRSHRVLHMLENGPPSRIERQNPHVPRDLQTITEAAMARDLRHRYAGARELAADLRRYLSFQTIRARPASWGQRVRSWVKQHKLRSTLIAGVAVIVVVALDRAVTSAKWHRLVAEGRQSFETGDSIKAALLFRQALEIDSDPSVQDDYDRAIGATKFTVHSSPPGADVWMAACDIKSGAPAALSRVGTTDPHTGRLSLTVPSGINRITVDKPDLGFTDIDVYLGAGSPEQILEARLRSTAEVIAGMVEVPSGDYWIGCDAYADGSIPSMDKHRQRVRVAAYYIDRYEVSNADYARFLAETGYPAPLTWRGSTAPVGEEDKPVTGVTWFDAMEFAQWAGKRLPTEDEWEIAARGPNGLRFPWGDDADPAHANVLLSALMPASESMMKTPSKRTLAVNAPTEDRSPFGVMHLMGNVREFVHDMWVPREDTPGRRSAPEARRVVRGACAGTAVAASRDFSASLRIAVAPESRDHFTGFRCAKSKKATPN